MAEWLPIGRLGFWPHYAAKFKKWTSLFEGESVVVASASVDRDASKLLYENFVNSVRTRTGDIQYSQNMALKF